MKQIKFRGKTLNSTAYFGDLIHRFGFPAVGLSGNFHEVQPDTVAQLVGYDREENEIYDNDILINSTGKKVTMNFLVELVDEDGNKEILEVGGKLYGYTVGGR